MHPPRDFTLGILAGGTGRRLMGRDKGLVCVDGEVLVNRMLNNWGARAVATLVNAHRNPCCYMHLADRVLCDPARDQGPCVGILALLAACESPLLLIAPVDLLHPAPDLPQRLIDALPDDAPGAFVRDGTGRQQLVLLLRQSTIADVQHYVARGGRKVSELIDELTLVPFSAHEEWQDIDCLEQLGSARDRAVNRAE